jgi:hypothetical protein
LERRIAQLVGVVWAMTAEANALAKKGWNGFIAARARVDGKRLFSTLLVALNAPTERRDPVMSANTVKNPKSHIDLAQIC